MKEGTAFTTTKTIATNIKVNKTTLITSKTNQMKVQEPDAEEVVNRLFAAIKAGASHTELAKYYDEKAEMFIPSDT
jgi:hypothetical protein